MQVLLRLLSSPRTPSLRRICGGRRSSIEIVAQQSQQRAFSATKSVSSTDKPTTEELDVLIVGGGAVGCSLARLLNETTPYLQVGLLEARDAPKLVASAVPNPRSYALSPKSLDILGSSTVEQLQLGYYQSMQVWQAQSPASLTFTNRDLNADPIKAPHLGACVEDGPLVAALWNQIETTTKCYTNAKVQSLSMGNTQEFAQVNLESGESLSAALVIGADGGNSYIRKECGISRTGTEYDQHALTFTVNIAGSLKGRAFQRYLDDGGPLALLPTYSDEHAVVVWSTAPETVKHWKDAPKEDLIRILNESLAVGPQRVPPLLETDSPNFSTITKNLLYGAERVLDTLHYGLAMASHHPNPHFVVPPRITDIASPKFSFPLSCMQANTYTKGRIALVGDAAHTVHPMAGQGLNLGLGDADELVKCIAKAAAAGMDVTTFLQDYNSNRQRNVSVALGGIHLLNRIFANNDVPLQHAKTLGMNVIQNFGTLRRQLAVSAAHGVSL
jgi:ubiquinone biosynthesis monooxygenase Coq6